MSQSRITPEPHSRGELVRLPSNYRRLRPLSHHGCQRQRQKRPARPHSVRHARRTAEQVQQSRRRCGSGRSLRGYCLCDTNTTGRDGNERYLRPSSVTLAALEFSWPVQPGEAEPRRETWGARIEYESPTAKPSTIWFCAGRRLAWQDFLNSEAGPQAMQFLPEDEFRTRVKRELDGDVWDRQKAYLDEMAMRSHLGFDPEQMGKTLPRAMAFEP